MAQKIHHIIQFTNITGRIMSFFGVTVNTIEAIYPHSNADKLELGKVSDLNFQFVVGTDNFKVGDEPIIFPLCTLAEISKSALLQNQPFLAG